MRTTSPRYTHPLPKPPRLISSLLSCTLSKNPCRSMNPPPPSPFPFLISPNSSAMPCWSTYPAQSSFDFCSVFNLGPGAADCGYVVVEEDATTVLEEGKWIVPFWKFGSKREGRNFGLRSGSDGVSAVSLSASPSVAPLLSEDFTRC